MHFHALAWKSVHAIIICIRIAQAQGIPPFGIEKGSPKPETRLAAPPIHLLNFFIGMA